MDKYDKAIEYLTKNPSKIRGAWNEPYGMAGGDLFKHAHGMSWVGPRSECGCIAQIRGDLSGEIYGSGFGPSVTKEIREDSRIPLNGRYTQIKDLPVFAEWQRRFDTLRAQMLKRRRPGYLGSGHISLSHMFGRGTVG